MRNKTNRLLMLLLGVAIAGCANQTDRSSSGGGEQAPIEREQVGGSSNAVPQEELDRRAAAAPAPAPQAAPAYEPEKESVQYIDRPIDETPPPKPAPVAAAPKDEAVAEFPVTTYELPEEQAPAQEEEVEELGPQDDESVSAEQDAAAAEESSVGETTEYAEDQQAEAEEVEDLGPVADESGTANYPQDQRAPADNVVGEPKMYADEPAPPKPAPAAPKAVSVSFETEPLFSFDKAEIRADQGAKLDEFVSSLGGAQYDSIAVVGHADRIGKEAYNQKLSERRANAVKSYLASKGVPADKIQTEGRGESDPVTGDTCAKTRGKALISCLQPDRRVDVSVNATK